MEVERINLKCNLTEDLAQDGSEWMNIIRVADPNTNGTRSQGFDDDDDNDDELKGLLVRLMPQSSRLVPHVLGNFNTSTHILTFQNIAAFQCNSR